jgi:PAS domain-containing protein
MLITLLPFSLLGLILSIIGGVLAFLLLREPVKLMKMVDEKDVLLNSADENYRMTLERINDAFMSLDTDWKFTYINSKAAEILQRDPAQLLGKVIWAEFPDMRNSPLYAAYHQAMRQQRYEYVGGYTWRYRLWFENHLYPSRNGLSVS